jgi:hypothetical protein
MSDAEVEERIATLTASRDRYFDVAIAPPLDLLDKLETLHALRAARAALREAMLALYGPEFTPQRPEDFPSLIRWRRALGEAP